MAINPRVVFHGPHGVVTDMGEPLVFTRVEGAGPDTVCVPRYGVWKRRDGASAHQVCMVTNDLNAAIEEADK